MNAINSLLTTLAEQLLMPFAGWPPQVGLIFWSAVAGVLMAWVFGRTSNQKALKEVADRIRAQLLAVKLFKDDLGITFRCQVVLMKATGLRLWHSLPPMLVLIVPFMFILSQLALRYEHRPLLPGEQATVEVQLAPSSWPRHNELNIEETAGVTVATDPVHDAAKHAVYWRVSPQRASTAILRWQLGDQVIEKRLAVAQDSVRVQQVSVRRPGPGWWDRLLFPAEAGFDATSAVQAVVIHHLESKQTTPLFGINVPWWATFLIISMLAALVARPFLRVHF